MKALSPLIILIFSLAVIYRGFVAFFPQLRGENRKKRKSIPKTHGIIYFFFGFLGLLYSLYVIYVFAGGAFRILPIDDKILFASADILLVSPIVLGFITLILTKIFPDKNKDNKN